MVYYSPNNARGRRLLSIWKTPWDRTLPKYIGNISVVGAVVVVVVVVVGVVVVVVVGVVVLVVVVGAAVVVVVVVVA